MKFIKKEVLKGGHYHNAAGIPLINYTVNYYLLGYLIHSITVFSITNDNAKQMFNK